MGQGAFKPAILILDPVCTSPYGPAASNQPHHEAGQMTAPDHMPRDVERNACINGGVHSINIESRSTRELRQIRVDTFGLRSRRQAGGNCSGRKSADITLGISMPSRGAIELAKTAGLIRSKLTPTVDGDSVAASAWRSTGTSQSSKGIPLTPAADRNSAYAPSTCLPSSAARI